METQELRKKVEDLVAEYIECDQAWGDSPMIEINPSTFEMNIVDEETDDSLDYVDMMDLLHMSVSNPGAWEADTEAILSLVESYQS
ncbi:MAG: hypothetical protein HDS82_04160 [Bacteroidales bacterium]|nr:hypothetical protein [Bacteroidales bacterium]